jgi:hypothetical protein
VIASRITIVQRYERLPEQDGLTDHRPDLALLTIIKGMTIVGQQGSHMFLVRNLHQDRPDIRDMGVCPFLFSQKLRSPTIKVDDRREIGRPAF